MVRASRRKPSPSGSPWPLLVSLAAWPTNALPRSLNALGIISAASGLITVIPGLEDVGMIFGLGLIIWFAWVGTVPLRNDTAPDATRVLAEVNGM